MSETLTPNLQVLLHSRYVPEYHGLANAKWQNLLATHGEAMVQALQEIADGVRRHPALHWPCPCPEEGSVEIYSLHCLQQAAKENAQHLQVNLSYHDCSNLPRQKRHCQIQ